MRYHGDRFRQRRREKQRRRKAAQAKRRATPPPSFIAIDGEGLAVPDGEQQPYVMMAANTGDVIENWTDGLNTHECLHWLLRLARRNRGARLVGFGLVYDFTQMMTSLTPDEAQRLAETGETWYQAAPDAGWYIRMMPRKMMSATLLRRPPVTPRKVKAHFTLYDAWGFFQASFVRALEDWNIGTPEQRAEVARLKEQRHTFEESGRAAIRAYCISEVQLLRELMDEVGRSLARVPSMPMARAWHGAGALADALLADRYMGDALTAGGEIPEGVSRAYYGGRIETMRAGIVDPPLFEYDINSAYPHALSQLPSMYGTWKRAREWTPHEHAVWRVRWDVRRHPVGQFFGPFPLRRGTSLWWPLTGRGWYLGCEVAAAREVFGSAIVVEGGYYYHGPDDEPWAWVRDLYDERLRLKAEDARRGTNTNKPLKLALNAMYGKTAQRPHWRAEDNDVVLREGKWRQPYVAAWQTALTRATLLRAAAQNPPAVVAFATDSLTTTEPLRLPESSALGAWECARRDEREVMIQPGFRISESGQVKRVRGGLHTSLGFADFAAAWTRDGFKAEVPSPDTRFIALRTAAGFGDVTRRGTWVRINRLIRFAPDRRRPGTRHRDYVRLDPLPAPDDGPLFCESDPVRPPSGEAQLRRWGMLDAEAVEP